MVIGGYRAENMVEAIDISGLNRICPSISDFPIDEQSVSAFINDKVIACGGIHRPNYIPFDNCYSYDPRNDLWENMTSMLSPRSNAAGVLISDTEWWISGGYDRSQMNMDSSELFVSPDEFTNFTGK